MAFQLSPGINVSEVDLTNATPAVGTTEGAIAGVFRWGPVNERILITSETELVNRFGEPTTVFTDTTNADTWTNHETFFTASNFLGYSDALYVTRVVSSGAGDDTDASIAQISSSAFKAKYYGKLGNSISVSWCKSGQYAAGSVVDSATTTTINVTPSSTIVTFNVFSSATTATAALKKGDRINVTGGTGQELVLAANATITGGTLGSAITFESDSAPSGVTDAGVIIHDGTNDGTILASSIINVGASQTWAAGDPVLYSAGIHGVLGGLVDGRIYFAIPVVANTGVKSASASFAFKLAATSADAIAHIDATAGAKNIQITTLSGGTSGENSLAPYSTIAVSGNFTTRYTGAVAVAAGTYTKQWGDANLFDADPTTGNIHLIVRDLDGKISGVAGTVIERYEDISTVSTAKKFDGTTNFITDVLFQRSKYIALAETDMAYVNTTAVVSSGTKLDGGRDGQDEKNITLGPLALGYDLYKDAADVDISFILQGKARSHTLANYIIDNVAEVRRDCVAFVSPELSDITVANIVDFAGNLTASSYAVVDSGYKYQYDKYADVYRWIPLNGDIAGLCARTDDLRDPWFSPAGYSRGNVKNAVKLQVNPNKAQRDLLYKNNVNPVITQPGQGTILFGDKTFSGSTSAFDRINVRRLFIVLEKTISRAAKSTLFEFNDEFTRAQFVNLVEPFLRDVQGRRGIYDFKVVWDATNNSPGVVDGNQFVGDIYIKPARSINFIQLNFVAVRSGVEFSEIVGAA